MRVFSYEEALAFIHATYGLGEKNGLENMRLLLARLSNPERDFPSIHVTGTNGKGSVCALTQAALRCAGLRTGLYTSPFLERFNERMRIDGVPIPDERLARLMDIIAPEVEALRAQGIKPTEFEIGTALAFLYFAREKVDVAVIEVGLGGRLDPTNVLTPRVCAIASIGLDHQRVLGDNLCAIAGEKAGIAKLGVPLVLSAQADDAVREVVRAKCEAVGAPFTLAAAESPYPLGLWGAHQAYNAGLAAEALRQSGLSVSEAAIRDGFSRARWPGRLEWIKKERMLLDGAHNPQGAEALSGYLRANSCGKTVLLCAIMKDKDVTGIVRQFAGMADEVVATQVADNHRSMGAEALAQAFCEAGANAVAEAGLSEAISRAKAFAGPDGRVVAAGSLYLVGAVRKLLNVGECHLLEENA